MLAPALQVAGAHNPFAINALCEDGSRKKTHVYGKGDKQSSKHNGIGEGNEPKHVDADAGEAEDASVTESMRRRPRTRDRIRSAFGRSLSPWRYHNVNGPERKHGWNLSKQSRDSLDVQREKVGQVNESEGVDTESDAESIRSGIVPRNSAFANFSEDSDSEDEMGVSPHHHHRESHRRGRGVNASAVKTEDKIANDEVAQKEVEDRGAGEAVGSADEQPREEDEDSDEYVEFDEETLDNTLFNAGCIDLHDAWLKDDHAPLSHGSDGGHAHYGPDDYDAALEGAGPSGHDETDEGLRAPNVVIGQGKSISPSVLEGDGLDVLSIIDKTVSPIDRPLLSHSSSALSAEEKTLTSHTTTSATDSLSTASKTEKDGENHPSQRLTASRPIFEKNRCTITLVHGEYDRLCGESKRPRRYIVASDGSEESSYAIEWTIGTVLRDGDEMLVVSVMETDTKLDASDAKHEDPHARKEHQRIRQSMAVILARRAVAVLQRTRLAVRVSCQALHARNSRHMFIDMIDFFEPTMCVVGSRGLGSLKGVLLGSFSHYCVQKSPVPVMVARKRMKLPPLPRGKVDVVSNVRARHMRLDQAIIEKEPNVSESAPNDGEGEEKSEGATKADKTETENATTDKTTPPSSALSPTATEDAEQSAKEQEETSAIKRDAAQATELQEKEKKAADKKQAKKDKETAKSEAHDGRTKKKFAVGGASVGGQEESDEEGVAT
jgi:nucleotide-binding universal stress UspA family protein